MQFPLPKPEDLVTSYDRPDDYAREQYATGRKYGENASVISISYNGAWGATMKDGSHVTAYERLGYHRSTADLFRGFIDSGATINNLCDFASAYWLERKA